jgi:RNA polymerase sigma-70 factor (ECF subfamily)
VLVARAPHDPDAFSALFRRHVDAVHRFVWRRTRDDALADDLTAVVFERFWARAGTLRLRHDSLRPWLIRVAANEIASHFRSEARRRRREDVVARREAPRHIDDGGFDDPALLRALASLESRHQEVLSLRFFAELSTEEAARAMDVNRRHFAVLQHRALAALRRALERGDDR